MGKSIQENFTWSIFEYLVPYAEQTWLTQSTEAVARRCSVKKGF